MTKSPTDHEWLKTYCGRVQCSISWRISARPSALSIPSMSIVWAAMNSALRPEPLCIWRSEEHTSELQSLMRISYAVFCLKKKNIKKLKTHDSTIRKPNNHV